MRNAIAVAEANPLELSEEGILGAASEATGLSDFGPEDFRERLRRLINEWNGDTQAYALSRTFLLGYLIRYAKNRLLIQDVLKQHPEIHEETIERPIIVVGLPHSGGRMRRLW